MLLKTENGGEIWVEYETGVTEMLLTVYFINELIGYAVGDKLSNECIIIKTTDGRITWKKKNLFTNMNKNKPKWGGWGSDNKNFPST
jgi:hypothetical protein